MKKAFKIADRLEQNLPGSKSDVVVTRNRNLISIKQKTSSLLFLFMKFILIVIPLLLIGFKISSLSLIEIIGLILCSIFFMYTFYHGPYQVYDKLEIDLDSGNIRLIGKGMKTGTTRTIKTCKSNSVLKETIPYSDSLGYRLTLVNGTERIPLMDLEGQTPIDQIHLLLKLLVKYEAT